MRSKKSFYNRMIVKKDIVRFWPLWGILLLLLQMTYTMPVLFNGLYVNRQDSGKARCDNLICNGVQKLYSAVNPFLIAGFAILAAVLVFGYLFKKRETYMMHSFPVSRETWFVSHFIAGFLMTAVPYIFTCLMIGLVSAILGVNIAGAVFGAILELLLMLIFFYTLACLVVMLSGNAVISIIIYSVLNVFVMALAYFVSDTTQCFVNDIISYGRMNNFGKSDVLWQFIICATPIAKFSTIFSHQMLSGTGMYLRYNVRLFDFDFNTVYNWDDANEEMLQKAVAVPWHEIGEMAWYIIPAALFIALAFILYRKRSLERVGDSLAFPWGKPVFHWVFTICGSFLFAIFAYYIAVESLLEYIGTYRRLFWVGIVCLLIGSVVCFIVSNMILMKTFRVWKKISFVQMGVCAACVLVLFYVSKYQVTHKNLPAADDINNISVEITNMSMQYSKVSLYNQDDIARIVRNIDEILEKSDDMPIDSLYDDWEDFSVDIMCYMGDGGVSEFSVANMGNPYYKEMSAEILDVLNSQESMSEKVLSRNYRDLDENGYIFYLVGDDAQGTLNDSSLPRSDNAEVYHALCADIEEGNIHFDDGILSDSDSDNYRDYFLTVCLLPEGKKAKKLPTEGAGEEICRISLTSDCKNLWKVLSDHYVPAEK